MPTLAALTPPDIEVVLTDENIESINFNEKVDLVGITFNVTGVSRAYEIADEFRRRKVAVILGGVYTSMLPEEAGKHADTIVIGEAEGIWEKIIRDFQKNELQKIYRSNQLDDLKNSPIPRWDLLKSKFYNYFSLQTTRGCPFDCNFCSVTYIFGGTYRHKPIESVINEINFLKKIDKNKLIFFVDDNISGNRGYAKELCKALIPLKIRWYSQAPILVAKDEELLELMYESGCRELFIGFESLSQDSLEAMGKGKINKVEEYEESIDKIYSHGMSIFGSFMLGGEYDDDGIFERTIEFINNNSIPFSLINIVVPPPGTKLFQRLEEEGRIIHRNWGKYTGEFVTFMPKKISPQLLQKSFYRILEEIYSYENIYKRLNKLWNRGLLISKRKLSRYKFHRLKLIVTTIFLFLIQGKFNNLLFFLKCIFNSKNPLLTPIFLSISLHDYTSDLLKED